MYHSSIYHGSQLQRTVSIANNRMLTESTNLKPKTYGLATLHAFLVVPIRLPLVVLVLEHGIL